MELFNGQTDTEVLTDLSDESIYASQTEEPSQEEPSQEAPEGQAEPANEETASEAEPAEEQAVDWQARFEESERRAAQLDQSYRALRADYNARNTANNARISELEEKLAHMPAVPEAAPADPELAKVLDPYLAPYRAQLDSLKSEITAEKQRAVREAQDARVNDVVKNLPQRFPEIKDDGAITDVIAEAVKLSTENGDPDLYRKHPEMVFTLAAENLYGAQRIEAASKAAAAAAEQARAATLKEQAAKEAGKAGLDAATTKNRSDVPPAETEEERIQREIASASGMSGLFR